MRIIRNIFYYLIQSDYKTTFLNNTNFSLFLIVSVINYNKS